VLIIVKYVQELL